MSHSKINLEVTAKLYCILKQLLSCFLSWITAFPTLIPLLLQLAAGFSFLIPCQSVPAQLSFFRYSSTQALSILIPFQTKTELFCSVYKKICVHTYRFRIVFARPCCDADQERSLVVAFVRHFGYSRSSGLAPGLVYFDDVTVFR